MKRSRQDQEREKEKELPWQSGTSVGTWTAVDSKFAGWAAPEEGINIKGGFVTLSLPTFSSQKIFAKSMDRLSVLNAVAADQIRRVFFSEWCASVGTCHGRFSFDSEVVIERPNKIGRGDIHIKTKAPKNGDWFLLARFIEAPTLRAYVRKKYGLECQKLQLPGWDKDPAFMRKFVQCFALRMILGVTDPGPGNFLVREISNAEPEIYSLDEGSAFSLKLAPKPMPWDPMDDREGKYKPWLKANLAGKDAILALSHPSVFEYVQELYKAWHTKIWTDIYRGLFEGKFLNMLREIGFTEQEAQHRLNYVMYNVRTLLDDWKILVGKQ